MLCSTDINNSSFATVLWKNSCRWAWGTATGLVQQEGNCHVKLSWLFTHFLLPHCAVESLALFYLFPLLNAVIVSEGGSGRVIPRSCAPEEESLGAKKEMGFSVSTQIFPDILRLVKLEHLCFRGQVLALGSGGKSGEFLLCQLEWRFLTELLSKLCLDLRFNLFKEMSIWVFTMWFLVCFFPLVQFESKFFNKVKYFHTSVLNVRVQILYLDLK